MAIFQPYIEESKFKLFIIKASHTEWDTPFYVSIKTNNNLLDISITKNKDDATRIWGSDIETITKLAQKKWAGWNIEKNLAT